MITRIKNLTSKVRGFGWFDIKKPSNEPSNDITKISIVVICYNMKREIKRTLESLMLPYQEGIGQDLYEVIVVENGSTDPLEQDYVKKLPSNFKYVYRETKSKSPAEAINYGFSISSGDVVGVIIDGARMLSPGVLHWVWRSFSIHHNPVVAVLGFHLGVEHQKDSVLKGYSKEVEDKLLSKIKWKTNGYRLFEISSVAGSAKGMWLGNIAESNCLFMKKDMFQKLEGYDERFAMPGGGLVNLDFYKRAVEFKGSQVIYIVGEGCFHQLHGGVTTGGGNKLYTFAELTEEYKNIYGVEYSVPEASPIVFGHNRHETAQLVEKAARRVFEISSERTEVVSLDSDYRFLKNL